MAKQLTSKEITPKQLVIAQALAAFPISPGDRSATINGGPVDVVNMDRFVSFAPRVGLVTINDLGYAEVTVRLAPEEFGEFAVFLAELHARNDFVLNSSR